MNRNRRVVVTGVGAVTPIGIAEGGLWAGLRAETSAVRAITRFDASPFRSRNAGEVRDFVPTEFLERRKSKRLDRFGQFSVVSARLAAEDAELDLAREDRERIGAMMGSALGGISYAEEQVGEFLKGGLRAVDPLLALSVFGGASSCNIAIELGVQGPNSTNAMSCASGTIAVGEAFRQVRDGYADIMLCGGAEAPLAPLCFGAFALIRAMSTRNDDPAHASRPFDRDRDGFVMGEGAAVIVLEERARAMARGARIYAEVLGFGMSNDAHHMTAPLPGGAQAARSMLRALEDAHVAPTEISYVNAHGSSTPLNDSTETEAIKLVFGDHAYRLQVSGTKGYYGHALGASGAIEAAICSQALANGWLPPTVNLSETDEACDLDYIPARGREASVEHLLTNSFGFGGINAALVMRRDS
ncbi:MAG: beta-ketoacyl-ACP synthase II [Gemmatimonadaceae bacterium]